MARRGSRFVAAWHVMTEGEGSMPDHRKDPTPISSRRTGKAPQPIVFPRPALTDEQLRNLVAAYVARLLYKTALQMTDMEIIEMGEQQFEAFCRSVLQDEDE